MAQQGYAFYEAADYVCEKRPIVCPNLGFIKQLQLYEKMKFNIEGNTEHHAQYQKLKKRSLLTDEKVKWQATPEKVMSPYFGDHVYPASHTDSKHIKCSQCHQVICHGPLIVHHEQGEGSNMWDVELKPKSACDSMYVVPSSWMADIAAPKGQLLCPACNRVVGGWDWQDGLECGCGHRSRPSFVLSLNKVMQ